jgi:[acyl-carrier-protein] S-malonyltransferase
MQVAEAGLEAQLAEAALVEPRFPVVSNVTARPVRDVVEARRLLVRQLTAPVRWTDSMRTMVAEGAARFFELGPGNVLTGLLKRIERTATGTPIGTPEDVASLGAG